MHEKSIDLLNQGVADEMLAVHQYMYFHFICDDQGYDPLAALFKRQAIDEMLHVESLAERILFLGGEVEMKAASDVQKVHDIGAILKLSKEMEEAAIITYNKFAKQCAEHGDSASKKLFEDLVTDEETHYDNFDTQEEHLKKFGEQFLALQSIERSKSISSGGGSGGA